MKYEMLGLVFCTSFIFTDFLLYRLHVFLWLLSVTVCTSIPLFVNNFASMDSLPLFDLISIYPMSSKGPLNRTKEEVEERGKDSKARR